MMSGFEEALMRRFIAIIGLVACFMGGLWSCAGSEGALDATASTQELIFGPLQVVCPLPGGCVRGGRFNFGDDWSFGSCPRGTPKRHTGVDLHAEAGTPVDAPADGTVMLVYDAGQGWASAILIEHRDAAGKPYVTQLMHVDPLVRAGDHVARGQQIATVADLPSPHLPHLHFGVWDGPYDANNHMMRRGVLPRAACGGDVAFPASFIDPHEYVQIN
jgi:murein DD-endopeptidase MepM/ murein hydrolase activator NlpD